MRSKYKVTKCNKCNGTGVLYKNPFKNYTGTMAPVPCTKCDDGKIKIIEKTVKL